jgi:hypothetical protein
MRAPLGGTQPRRFVGRWARLTQKVSAEMMLGLVIIATVVIIGVLRAVLQLAKQLGGKLLLIVPTAKTVLALSVCGMLAGAVAYAVATMKAKTKNINKQGAASKETNQTQTQKKHFADLLHRVEFDKSVHAKVLVRTHPPRH